MPSEHHRRVAVRAADRQGVEDDRDGHRCGRKQGGADRHGEHPRPTRHAGGRGGEPDDDGGAGRAPDREDHRQWRRREEYDERDQPQLAPAGDRRGSQIRRPCGQQEGPHPGAEDEGRGRDEGEAGQRPGRHHAHDVPRIEAVRPERDDAEQAAHEQRRPWAPHERVAEDPEECAHGEATSHGARTHAERALFRPTCRGSAACRSVGPARRTCRAACSRTANRPVSGPRSAGVSAGRSSASARSARAR